MPKNLILISVLFLICFRSIGQTATHTYNTSWFRLFLADKITAKLQCDVMIQHRREATSNQFDFVEKQQLQSYWLWFHYLLSKKIKISVSPFCYFETKHLFDLNERPVKEWRWCARIENQQKFNYFQMLNRLGLEYRYRNLNSETAFVGNFRARYMLRFIIPIVKVHDRSINFSASDEVLVQFGDAVKNYASPLDQNRIYAGLNYAVFKNIKLEVGYCYIMQNRPNGKDIDIQNSVLVFLTFDNVFTQFRKKQ